MHRIKDKFKIGGVLKARIVVPTQDAPHAVVRGMENIQEREFIGEWRGHKDVRLVEITGEKHNAFVNTGLNNNLDLWAGLGGTAVSHFGVTDDTTAVTATATKLDPTDDDTVTIVSATNVSRTNQTVSFDGVYSEANLAHVVSKIGLLNTATDAGTGLQNVIGGGGVAPYDETLTIDLTGATEFDLTLGIDVTAQAT